MKRLAVIVLVVIIIGIILFEFPTINSFVQQSGYDKLTLPIGTTVR